MGLPIYKIYHLANGDIVGLLLKNIAPNVLELNFYNNNKSVKMFSIIFSPIFMLICINIG
jgi:hypothetical protein